MCFFPCVWGNRRSSHGIIKQAVNVYTSSLNRGLGAVSLGSGLAFFLARLECLFSSVNWDPRCCGALAVFPDVYWKASVFWGRASRFRKRTEILSSTMCLFGTVNSCGLLTNGKYSSGSQRLAAYLVKHVGPCSTCTHTRDGAGEQGRVREG